MSEQHHCEVCGQPVVVVSDKDGTCHYEAAGLDVAEIKARWQNIGNNILASRSGRKYTPMLRGGCGRYPYKREKHLIMALDLWMYGDETGKKDSSFSVISAYIANPRQWDALRREWMPIIANAGVPELHAAKLFSRKRVDPNSPNKNPFAGWSDEDALAFIGALGGIVRRFRQSVRAIETVVDSAAFRALSQGERRALTGGYFLSWAAGRQGRKWKTSGKPSEPYLLAFHSVIGMALRVCPPDVKLHLVFDNNEDVQPYATQMLDEVRRMKLWPECDRLAKGIDFEDSEDFPGIQMADLRGFLLNRFALKGERGMQVDELFALRQIEGRTIEYELLDKQFMEKTLAHNLSLEDCAWLNASV